MSELTDQHLLSAWAERRDEAAFRSLLGRYAGFVYGVALRRMGDAGLAEEISQDVFARLAHHAPRLTAHPTLAGWLHRAAMLLVLDQHRRRARYGRKLERFTQMNTQPGRDPWTDAAAHLDEALDRLATRDREVLMLHFIEQRTFPEIAARLRSTPDAVRMRTNRALAELARLLGKRGTIIPAAALAAGLGTASAAPPSLLALAPAALAGAGKVSALSAIIHAVQTMKLAKAAAVALLALVLATPLIFQQQQIAAAEARIAGIQRNRAPDMVSQAREKPEELAATTKASHGIDIKQLGEDALDGGILAERRIRHILARLSTNNLTGLIETVMQSDLMPEHRDKLLLKLLTELQQRDKVVHLGIVPKVFAATVKNKFEFYAYQLRSQSAESFKFLATTDPDIAAKWATENRDVWSEFGGHDLEMLLAAGLLSTKSARAYEMMEKMSPERAAGVIHTARNSITPEHALALAKWAVDRPDLEKRRLVVREVFWSTPSSVPAGGKYLDRALPMLRALPLNDEDAAWMAVRIALDSVRMIESDITKEAKEELEWIDKVVPSSRRDYAHGAFGHFYNPDAALSFLAAKLDEAHSDDLIAGYVESEDMKWHGSRMASNAGRHGATAFRLATRVVDIERRIPLLVRAWTDLNKDDSKKAREILTIPELCKEDRATVESQIALLPQPKL